MPIETPLPAILKSVSQKEGFYDVDLIAVPARVRYGGRVTARSRDQGPVLNACDHRYNGEYWTEGHSFAHEINLNKISTKRRVIR